MDIAEYKKMANYERKYWWHIGRNHIVKRQLEIVSERLAKKNLKILNIGCGTGGTVPTLSEFGEVYNVDTEPLALELLKESGNYNVQLVDGIELPYEENFFDVIVALDVLEHIDAENAALKEWRRVLKTGGESIIMVPAYSWLWSQHDEALHHFRRYSRSHLATALHLADFTILKKSYAVSFSLPLVIGFRLLSKLSKKESNTESSYVDLPDPINRLFSSILKLEGNLLPYMNFIFGSSVLARAIK